MARGMIPVQGTMDPATAVIKKAGGQPPAMNQTKPPKGKGKKAPALKPAPNAGKASVFRKGGASARTPAFGGRGK